MLIIEEWTDAHMRWREVQAFIKSQGQSDWVTFTAKWHLSSHVLVALNNDVVVGFLRFVMQPIGPDMDCPEVVFSGERLLEAKVLAFAVADPHRRKGVGRALQEQTIRLAKERGCYQVRSHSGGDQLENHQLKLAMGFGVDPIVRGDDRRGAYFILPLRNHSRM